ncbi:hypothetical protein [Streptomyces sp. NPDC048057]|uniref:effector-associated constant component EACC1 n=1 Tax=Streptomyces sp. NPDC048057 TaxID=3155628 RepID=UPI0033FE8BBE
MELSLTIEGEGTGDDVASLYRWLSQDSDVTSQIDVRQGRSVSRPGEMSSALEVISLVTGNTIALANLWVAVRTWRSTRRPTPEVRIEHRGTSVTVNSDDPEKVRQLLAALENAPQPPEAAGQ